jgi:hypothetical protein
VLLSGFVSDVPLMMLLLVSVSFARIYYYLIVNVLAVAADVLMFCESEWLSLLARFAVA